MISRQYISSVVSKGHSLKSATSKSFVNFIQLIANGRNSVVQRTIPKQYSRVEMAKVNEIGNEA